MKKLLVLLFFVPSLLQAQTGLKFEHGLTWQEIKAKAKAENKFIFLDAYTTWCGPCIQMAKNIFPLDEVGKAMNPNFLNVKVQLDTTANDNEEVKQWYADGHEIMTKYNVRAFPTYLYFNPDGKLVHRAIGSSPAPVFIAKANDARNPEKQYYVLLDQYLEGKREPDFLRKMALAAQEAYDLQHMTKISKEYLSTQTDLATADNIEFIDRFTNSTKDEGFALLQNNEAAFDKIKGAGTANKKVVEIITREEVFPKIFRKDAPNPDWKTLETDLKAKYPKHAAEVISYAQVNYFQSRGDWESFQSSIVNYMKNYGALTSPEQLNNFAWTVFENCKDMNCVKEALAWSRKSFKDNNNPMFIDTYANILYKMGKTKEAIEWQQKAVSLVGEGEKQQYTETLDKMKKGEKTWKHN